MTRGYSQGKRQREDEQSRKRQDKERRRSEKRDAGPREVPIVEGGVPADDSPSLEDIMRTLERGGVPDRSAAALPARLFVGGLDDQVTEADLKTAFGQFGPVADCIVMRDRDTRASRGFGFVTMADRKDAPRAIAGLHGTDLMGRNLVVNVATERGR
jgi:RNA recognition motif-containing protein